MKQRQVHTSMDKAGTRTLDLVVAKYPETVEEAVEQWGEEVVWSLASKAAIIQLQGKARGMMRKEGDDRNTDEQILNMARGWKPVEGREVLSDQEKVKRLILKSGLDKEALKALLKECS